MTSDPYSFNTIDECIRDWLLHNARARERQVARALLRGAKSIDFPEPGGRVTRYDLTTKWWQVILRRKMMRLARKELDDE